jgi:hypothetical protein
MNLARWLLARELADAHDPGALAAAAERVCHKLAVRLARLITPTGYEALVARALHFTRGQFGFLVAVQVGSGSGPCLVKLAETVQGVDPAEVYDGLAALLAHIIELLTTFIGDDLTLHLLAEVWPDVPPGRAGGGA